jgi:hypothetical protein
MRHFFSMRRLAPILPACAGVFMVQQASGLTVAFVLNNITYSNTVFPFSVTTGNGLMSWTYTAGDFANGAGQYIFVNLPPNAIPPSSAYGPIYSADGASVTGTITQNVDCYWYDWAINFSPALTSPGSTAQITGGNYDLASGSCQNFLGQVIGGTVTPFRPALTVRNSGTNAVVSWATNYADGFILESAAALHPDSQWRTSSLPASVVGEKYVVTNSLATGANLFSRLAR